MTTEPLPKPDYLGEPIGYRVLCPHCNLAHDVNPYISPPEVIAEEPGNTRQWVICPTMSQEYLVGIGGYLFLMQEPPFVPVNE